MATPLSWVSYSRRNVFPGGLSALLCLLPALVTASGARSLLAPSCPADAQSCFTADGSTEYCCPANYNCCSGPNLTCYPQGQAYPSNPSDFVNNGFLPGAITTAAPGARSTATPAPTQNADNPGSGSGTPKLNVIYVNDFTGFKFSDNTTVYSPTCPPGTLATGGGCQCGYSVPVNTVGFKDIRSPVLTSNFLLGNTAQWQCLCPTCPSDTIVCGNVGTVACASLTF